MKSKTICTKTIYSGVGIRTTYGVFWLTLFLVTLATNSIVLYEIRTHHHVRAVLALLWVTYVAISTTRALFRLSALDEEQPEPDDAMKLAFQLVRVQPILGTVPVFLWFSLL
jgi:hypothetical protein